MKQKKNMSKFALLVGCNYVGTNAALGGCINDTKILKDLLVKEFHYEEQNIVILTDETKEKPTKAIIERHLEDLLGKDSEELWFSFSGHGSYRVDTSGDETDRRDETICPLDYATAGMITDDYMQTLLAKVPATTRVNLLIDSCHSGTMGGDLRYSYAYKQERQRRRIRKRVRRGRRWVYTWVTIYGRTSWVWKPRYENRRSQIKAPVFSISGCLDNDYSADWYIPEVRKTQGALTYGFTEIVKRNKGKLTCQALGLELNRYMKENGLSQTPVLGSSFPLTSTYIFVEKLDPSNCCIST